MSGSRDKNKEEQQEPKKAAMERKKQAVMYFPEALGDAEWKELLEQKNQAEWKQKQAAWEQKKQAEREQKKAEIGQKKLAVMYVPEALGDTEWKELLEQKKQAEWAQKQAAWEQKKQAVMYVREALGDAEWKDLLEQKKAAREQKKQAEWAQQQAQQKQVEQRMEQRCVATENRKRSTIQQEMTTEKELAEHPAKRQKTLTGSRTQSIHFIPFPEQQQTHRDHQLPTTRVSIPEKVTVKQEPGTSQDPVMQPIIDVTKDENKAKLEQAIHELRGNSTAKFNCNYLCWDLNGYFRTGIMPSTKSKVSKSTGDDIKFFEAYIHPGYRVVKKEKPELMHTVPDSLQVVRDNIVGSTIRPAQVYYEKDEGGFKEVVDLAQEKYTAPSVKHYAINQALLAEAEKYAEKASFGIIALVGFEYDYGEKMEEEQHHTLVYHANAKNNSVTFIDCHKWNDKTKTGAIFTDLSKNYHFITPDIDDNVDIYWEENVFYIPLHQFKPIAMAQNIATVSYTEDTAVRGPQQPFVNPYPPSPILQPPMRAIYPQQRPQASFPQQPQQWQPLMPQRDFSYQPQASFPQQPQQWQPPLPQRDFSYQPQTSLLQQPQQWQPPMPPQQPPPQQWQPPIPQQREMSYQQPPLTPQRGFTQQYPQFFQQLLPSDQQQPGVGNKVAEPKSRGKK